jgi:EAL domain-containing protein (putative c-di-GMP-specific phosphodiesterase class I)
MIVISTERADLLEPLAKRLEELQIEVRHNSPSLDSFLEFYQQKISCLVIDSKHPSLPDQAWMDLVNSMGRRVPVIVLTDVKPKLDEHKNEPVFWVVSPTVESVCDALAGIGVLGKASLGLKRNAIATCDIQVPKHMLTRNGSLSVLLIDASSFQKLSADYGNEVFLKMQNFFERQLFSLWGAPGSFRSGDVLCKKTPTGCIYYIFLELSRASRNIPVPGALEKLADRLSKNLQYRVWSDFFKPRAQREIPESIEMVPEFSVGHATVLYNPCTRPQETIEALLDTAIRTSLIQQERILNRQMEILQTLIQYEGLIYPHFQAVFWAQGITNEDAGSTQNGKTLANLSDKLYGFESLIRISHSAVDKILDEDGPVYLEGKYLRPDVLFGIAAKCRLSLELDQACIQLGSRFGAALPGKLLINILPRNLYYVENIQHMIPPNMEVIFELSESEAINNFDLLMKVRDTLMKMNLGIAADDFGKGYAGLDRVIKVKPDLIKLDRILIQNIDRDEPKKAFVKGLVEAARTSKSKILAEGVETVEEFEVLRSLGIDLVQGFLFHRPQSLEVILQDLVSAENVSGNTSKLQKSA